MPNLLTLTAAITVAQIRLMRVLKYEFDEDAHRLLVQILVSSAAGVVFPPVPWVLEVLNGAADGIAAHPNPPKHDDTIISVRLKGAGVATAYDTVKSAYDAAGADKRGAMLTALKGITGTVAGGPLDASTQPILPPGAVS